MQSNNSWESPAYSWVSGVQTKYDIVKAHGRVLKVETKVDEGNSDKFGKGEGTNFIIHLSL